MKKTSLALIMTFALVCAFLCSCGMVKSPDKYELSEKDSVVSITKVVGEREVKTTKVASQYVKYVYKNVQNTKSDVEKYAAQLVGVDKFTANKKYKNMDPTGEIKFTKTSSSDKNYLIIVTVTYTEDEYTIVAERENKVV